MPNIRNKKMVNYRTFNEALIEDLKNSDEAKAFLENIIAEYEEDSDAEALMLALRMVAEAQGGISKLAARAKLNRQTLYKVLAGKTTPKLDTTLSIMKGLGFRFSIQDLPKHHAKHCQ
jgi:probable addiction module antidote protein